MGLYDSIFQNFIYWIMGSMSDLPGNLAYLVGVSPKSGVFPEACLADARAASCSFTREFRAPEPLVRTEPTRTFNRT